MVCRKYDFNMNICTYTGKQCFNTKKQKDCIFYEEKHASVEDRLDKLEREVAFLKNTNTTSYVYNR